MIYLNGKSMYGQLILREYFTYEELVQVHLWALSSRNIHRGNAVDGKYYAEHDGEREYNVWWTTQPPESMWIPIVKRIEHDITSLMLTNRWTIHAVDCITTRPGSTKVHAHIDFPYKFKETKLMQGVLGVQIIIPLDDFTIKNGGTMYLPDSDKMKLDYDTIRSKQDEYNDLLLNDGIQFQGQVGDVLLYDGKTLHSTMPNKSENFRSALLINAIRNDALQIVRDNDVNTDENTRGFYSPAVDIQDVLL
jgi:ectoine hydroxylase-related dioxygenase (phytanoyl-CoA dioxygenase family)